MNFDHWLWGENKLREDKPEYLINLDVGVSIRYDPSLSTLASYEEFYDSIADIQFLSGVRPSPIEVEKIKVEAWNYLIKEEEKLDELF